LGAAGRAWWRWAWSTPQAAAWDDGSVQVVLRRARLEDMVAALEHIDLDIPSDPDELAGYVLALKATLAVLKSSAAGGVTVMREMRELDDRLGLTPKAMAQLRWTVVPDMPESAPPGDESSELVSRLADRRRRLADAS